MFAFYRTAQTTPAARPMPPKPASRSHDDRSRSRAPSPSARRRNLQGPAHFPRRSRSRSRRTTRAPSPSARGQGLPQGTASAASAGVGRDSTIIAVRVGCPVRVLENFAVLSDSPVGGVRLSQGQIVLVTELDYWFGWRTSGSWRLASTGSMMFREAGATVSIGRPLAACAQAHRLHVMDFRSDSAQTIRVVLWRLVPW